MKSKDNKQQGGASSRQTPRSYAGYIGNRVANAPSAINEFEDNLNVDWEDNPSEGTEHTSVTNRLKPHQNSPSEEKS